MNSMILDGFSNLVILCIFVWIHLGHTGMDLAETRSWTKFPGGLWCLCWGFLALTGLPSVSHTLIPILHQDPSHELLLGMAQGNFCSMQCQSSKGELLLYQTPKLLGSAGSRIGKPLDMRERQFCGTNSNSCNRTIPQKSRNPSLLIFEAGEQHGKSKTLPIIPKDWKHDCHSKMLHSSYMPLPCPLHF